MAIDVGSLLSTPDVYSNSSVYDVVTGSNTSSASLLSSSYLSDSSSGLTQAQSEGLSFLEDFINEYVEGPKGQELQVQLEALTTMMSRGNASTKVALDPVLSLLQQIDASSVKPLDLSGLDNGSFIDELI